MASCRLRLNDPRYTKPIRLRGTTGATIAKFPKEAATRTRAEFSECDKRGHLAVADQALGLKAKLETRWGRAVDSALAEYGDGNGRLISGVVRDHFPEKVKNRLRLYAHSASKAGDVGHAHWAAAGKRTPFWQEIERKRGPR